jgi:endonuclease/exonuclease/phosphatase (EEP) superfamily protein YafD
MSQNLLKDNEDRPAILAQVMRQSPDILLVQELASEMYQHLQAELPDYPHRHWRPHPKSLGGLGIFSRLPFEITGAWELAGTRTFALRATLDLAGSPVDIYNLHLMGVGAAALRKTGLTRNFRLRELQIETLLREVADREYPVLWLGDHNMTEGGAAYRLATSQLADVWLQLGCGPGWTWPRTLKSTVGWNGPFPPLLRLDYCFCAGNIRPLQMDVVYEWTGSDHCPIVVQTGIG